MVKVILRVEGAFICGLCAYFLFGRFDAPWWVLPIFILGPDVSMIGYLINPRIGSVAYNVAHTFIVAIAIGAAGVILENNLIVMTGLILAGHSGMDRAFGFGLKYATEFKDTHLGKV
jgi:hypothetical protein